MRADMSFTTGAPLPVGTNFKVKFALFLLECQANCFCLLTRNPKQRQPTLAWNRSFGSCFSPRFRVSVVRFGFPITAISRDYGDLGDSS
jgi:hypothetical protein